MSDLLTLDSGLVLPPTLSSPIRDARPRLDTGRMVATVVISTQAEDRSRDVVLTKGIRTENHRINPVVLLEHGENYALPLGKSLDDTGRYTVRIDGAREQALGTTFFSQHTLEAEQAYQLIDEGVLRGASLGFRPIKARKRQLPHDPFAHENSGLLIEECEMLEYSHCVIPDNQECVVAVASVMGKNRLAGRQIAPMIRKSLTPYLPKPKAQVVGGYEAKGKALISVKDLEPHMSAESQSESQSWLPTILQALVYAAAHTTAAEGLDPATKRAVRLLTELARGDVSPEMFLGDALQGPSDPMFKAWRALTKKWVRQPLDRPGASQNRYVWDGDQSKVRYFKNPPTEREARSEKPERPTPEGMHQQLTEYLSKPEGVTEETVADVAAQLEGMLRNDIRKLAKSLGESVGGLKKDLAWKVATRAVELARQGKLAKESEPTPEPTAATDEVIPASETKTDVLAAKLIHSGSALRGRPLTEEEQAALKQKAEDFYRHVEEFPAKADAGDPAALRIVRAGARSGDPLTARRPELAYASEKTGIFATAARDAEDIWKIRQAKAGESPREAPEPEPTPSVTSEAETPAVTDGPPEPPSPNFTGELTDSMGRTYRYVDGKRVAGQEGQKPAEEKPATTSQTPVDTLADLYGRAGDLSISDEDWHRQLETLDAINGKDDLASLAAKVGIVGPQRFSQSKLREEIRGRFNHRRGGSIRADIIRSDKVGDRFSGLHGKKPKAEEAKPESSVQRETSATPAAPSPKEAVTARRARVKEVLGRHYSKVTGDGPTLEALVTMPTLDEAVQQARRRGWIGRVETDPNASYLGTEDAARLSQRRMGWLREVYGEGATAKPEATKQTEPNKPHQSRPKQPRTAHPADMTPEQLHAHIVDLYRRVTDPAVTGGIIRDATSQLGSLSRPQLEAIYRDIGGAERGLSKAKLMKDIEWYILDNKGAHERAAL